MNHRERFYEELKQDLKGSLIQKNKKYVKLLPRDLSKWDGNKYKGDFYADPKDT